MEARLKDFSQDSFDEDDQHFKTVTSLIHLIDENSSTSSAAEGTNEKPTKKNLLKYLAIASFIIARHCEVVAAIPKYSGTGVKVYVAPQSDTSSDEQSDTSSLDRVILCTNETLESGNIDSSITEYIHNN
jgi:hypothetical protein